MPALTPNFVMDLESNMRMIQENEYLRLSKDLWWNAVIPNTIKSGSRREILTWVLNTAQLEGIGKGGNISFDDMSIVETEFESNGAGKALKLRRQQFEDLDGNGVKLATEWVAQMSAQFAYWPQRILADAMKTAHTSTFQSYDNVPFFSASHPLNPVSSGGPTYSNLITNVPIDVSVSADTALANLQTVFSTIAEIKMPNGSDPRRLRPRGIIANPRLFPRAVQLTSAKFLAQAASAGGGSGDVEALISSMAYGQPICADEFAGFESNTTYFVVAEQLASSQLGAMVYVDREPFGIRYYTGRGGGTGVDAVLDRADELEWHGSGRNMLGPGHPYLLFKCKAGA